MAMDKEMGYSVDRPENPIDVFIPNPTDTMPILPETPNYGGGARNEIPLSDDDLLPYYLKVQVDIMIDSLRFGATYGGVDVDKATEIIAGIVKKSTFNTKIVSPDATDLDSLIILVNEIKEKFNLMVDADISAGQR